MLDHQPAQGVAPWRERLPEPFEEPLERAGEPGRIEIVVVNPGERTAAASGAICKRRGNGSRDWWRRMGVDPTAVGAPPSAPVVPFEEFYRAQWKDAVGWAAALTGGTRPGS
jgi:hypothetical protein